MINAPAPSCRNATVGHLLHRLALLALVAGLLPSCNSLLKKTPFARGFNVPNRAIGLDQENKSYSSYLSPTRFNYVDAANPLYFRNVYDQAGNAPQALKDKDGNVTNLIIESKITVRNQIAKEMAALVDENHDIYHEHLRRNLTGTRLWSDFFDIGLTASAAIANGAHATKSLAALATGTKGMGESVSNRVLQQQTLSSVLKAMEIRKERIYGEMQSRFDTPADKYGLEDVIRDLGRYWKAGLLSGGLAELDQLASNKLAGVEAKTAESRVQATQNKPAGNEAKEGALKMQATTTTE